MAVNGFELIELRKEVIEACKVALFVKELQLNASSLEHSIGLAQLALIHGHVHHFAQGVSGFLALHSRLVKHHQHRCKHVAGL